MEPNLWFLRPGANKPTKHTLKEKRVSILKAIMSDRWTITERDTGYKGVDSLHTNLLKTKMSSIFFLFFHSLQIKISLQPWTPKKTMAIAARLEKSIQASRCNWHKHNFSISLTKFEPSQSLRTGRKEFTALLLHTISQKRMNVLAFDSIRKKGKWKNKSQ